MVMVVLRKRAFVLSAVIAVAIMFLIGMAVYVSFVTTTTIVRVIVYGMSVGGAYALIAIGFSLIFGVARLLNMAQAGFFVLGGYITWILVDAVFDPMGLSPHVQLFLSAVCAMAIMFLIGMAVYMSLIPVETSLLGVLMVTAAVNMIIVQTLTWQYGTTVRPLPYAAGDEVSTILGVKIHNQYLVIFGVSIIALFCLLIFLQKAKFGKAIRAAAQDREAAMLMGVSTIRVNAATFGISAALSTLAAALTCSIPFALEPLIMPAVTLGTAFAIVVLGGLGSLSGTVLGAFIISYTGMALQEYSPGWYPGLGAYITAAVVPLSIVIVLLIRPTGILGRPIKELL